MPDATTARRRPLCGAAGLLTLLALPALVGLHCPRRCPDEGPRFEAPVELVGASARRVTLRRQLLLAAGVVRQELRVRELAGALELRACADAADADAAAPWSTELRGEPGATVELPATLDCVVIARLEPEAAPWTLRADLIVVTEHAITGVRGQGVHGQQCPPLGVDWRMRYD